MISYAIEAALQAKGIARVVVSTDDEEIALLSERFGATALIRPQDLAEDKTTLDPVIYQATNSAEEKFGENYNFVITIQPTSPLIKTQDINNAIEKLTSKPDIDTILSVVDDRHLCWTIKDGYPVPAYSARVNRQQLPPSFKETGAIIGCTRSQLASGSRIGANVALLEMPASRSFDIDSISDLYLCESIISRKKIVFTVVGYPEVGLGHAYRALMLAHELVNHEIVFICEQKSLLAAEQIKKSNYKVEICENGKLADTVISHAPTLVINDILDTSISYIEKIRDAGIKIVNFEDLGDGYKKADLVINALYPGELPVTHALVGHQYFCLRDEFIYSRPKPLQENVRNILISFGGVDEGNLTERVFRAIADYCLNNEIHLNLVTGPGYQHFNSLHHAMKEYTRLSSCAIHKTSRISDYMIEADLAITSGGRTVLELSSLQVPTIVICQNVRETTHLFASKENGILNLGYRESISDAAIFDNIKEVIESPVARREMHSAAKGLDLREGKNRVISKITELLQA